MTKIDKIIINNPKIKIGLLLNDKYISAWAYTMLENIIRDNLAEIVLLIFKLDTKDNFPVKKRNCKPKIIQRVYKKIDKWGFKSKTNAFEARDIRFLLQVEEISIKTSETNCYNLFFDDDLDKLRGYDIDIFIKLGFDKLEGSIMSIPKLGVWTIIPEDDNLNCTSIPGFWDVMKVRKETKIELHLLNENKSKNKVLYSSSGLTDRLSVERNNNKNFWKAANFIPRELNRINSIGKKRYLETLSSASVLLENSQIENDHYSNQKILFEIIKLQIRRFRNKLLGKIFITQWALIYQIKSEDIFDIDLRQFKKILPPHDRIWADPHVLKREDKYFIFIEELMLSTNKGHISVIEMDKEGNYFKPLKVLEEDYHLSYPFIIEDKGNVFMVPETNSENNITLYKCIEFPNKWSLEKVLMENVQAVDSTIFFENGKFWLFTNIAVHRGGSNYDELFLFFSNELLSNNWISHPQNPIISDVKSARPAGKLFKLNNKLYRPSQNCSKRYGFGLQINQVLTMNESKYEEKIIKSIFPDEDNNIMATHTFNLDDELVFLDFQQRSKRKYV